jgi:putative copper resistance protein D
MRWWIGRFGGVEEGAHGLLRDGAHAGSPARPGCRRPDESRVSVDWSQVLTHWQTDSVALVGMTLEAVAAVAYAIGVRRVRHFGRRWPVDRTAAFYLGLLCLAFALQSGFAAYDDELLWVHMSQHLLLMMVGAPLIAWAAPVRLWFAAGTRPMQRFAAEVLHDPSMRLVQGRRGAVLLPLDYYGAMALAVLTPLYRLSETSTGFHEFVHVYFLLCGLMFWVPILGHDPASWRPSFRLKVGLVAAGIPIYAAIAAGMWAEGHFISPEHSLADIHRGALTMLVGGTLLSLGALSVLVGQEVGRRRAARARANARPWVRADACTTSH